MKWLKHRRSWVIVIGAVVLLSGAIWYQESTPADQPDIKVSKETTFITEPLNAEGLPDYEKALDDRSRKGVTPENNAAIPFWRAFGPKSIPEPLREEFFKRLEIETLPEEGEYFVPLDEFVDSLPDRGFQISSDVFYDQFVYADEIPWKAEDYPAIAGWFKANEKPLELIVKASERPRFYTPYLTTSRGVDFAGFRDEAFSSQPARETYRILVCRATMQIGEGNLAGAIDDLQACHRLNRLFAQYPSSGAIEVAIVGDAVASKAEQALLDVGRLTSAELLKYQADLRSLGPLPGFAESYDYYERFNLLDSILWMGRHDSQEIVGFRSRLWFHRASDEMKECWKHRQRRIRAELVDWNEVLRKTNSARDDAVSRIEMTDRVKSAELIERIKERRKAPSVKPEDFPNYEKLIEYANDSWIGDADRVGATNWFIDLYTYDLLALSNMPVAERRSRMRYELVLLAFGLCAYRADHATYPEDLSKLIPKYATGIPKDLFSGKPVKYRSIEHGFVVYSVGENGKDEEGRGYETGHDDIAIQIPLPKH